MALTTGRIETPFSLDAIHAGDRHGFRPRLAPCDNRQAPFRHIEHSCEQAYELRVGAAIHRSGRDADFPARPVPPDDRGLRGAGRNAENDAQHSDWDDRTAGVRFTPE